MGIINYAQASNGGTNSLYSIEENVLGQPRSMRVVCMGAGATGLDFAYKIKKHLQSFELQIYEKNEELGGTWFENMSVTSW